MPERVHIIILPGLDGTGLLLDDFAAQLPARFTVHVIRYPPDRVLSYDEMTSFVRPQLPVNEPCILIAESYSGPIALTLAAEQPPALRALVLVASFARSPRPAIKYLHRLIPLLPIRCVPIAIPSHFLLGSHSSPQLRQLLRKASSSVNPRVIRRRLSDALCVDVSPQLQQISVPLLYLQAAHDRVVPPRAARHLQQYLPTLQISQFNTPHLLLQTQPRHASAITMHFIQHHVSDD